MGKLTDKVAVITGGTTGIGRAAAKLFHAEGARVFVTGSNPTTLDEARAELAGVAEVIASDAATGSEVSRLFAHVRETAGGLDVLFVNAGVVASQPAAEMSEEAFDRIVGINLKGAWLAIRAATPLLRRGGAVVLNGSVNGHLGMAGTTAYAASKAGVRSLGRTFASELAPHGVRVNVVSPGPTDSGIVAKAHGAELAAQIKPVLEARIPMGRMGHVDEVARVALFLACDDASFMTGEEIVVDGGMTRV